MFKNYIKLAYRNLFKNKLYTAINVIGLAIGLTIYIFTSLISEYERNHDTFFENSENIYALGIRISPKANMGLSELNSVFSAIGPLAVNEIEDIESMARTLNREFLLTVEDRHFYQTITFSDPDFTNIFDFDYVNGDASALQDPSAIILTQSMAQKLFPDGNALGKTITLDHKEDLHVAAIIKDIPINSHLQGNLMVDSPVEIIATTIAYSRISSFVIEGNYNNLSVGDNTYITLPPHLDGAWLENQLPIVQEKHFNGDLTEMVESMKAIPIEQMNGSIWDMVGMPVIESIKILGIMILVVACVNYTNLATAQAMGRAREVGLRKTMGAGRGQLLGQFLTESITITFISMVVAIGILELAISAFNGASGKILALNYADIMPWLITTVLGVGLLAGSYPAFLITKTNAIDTLRDTARKGKSGSRIRTVMIGVQFGLSIFMLASVGVMYFQNMKIEEGSEIFPKDQIVNLQRVATEDIRPRHETLKTELLALEGVENVAFTSQVPFDQSTSSRGVSLTPGDASSEVVINIIRGDETFTETYGMPILAGRTLSKDFAQDRLIRGEDYETSTTSINVILNELAVQQLGISSSQEAIGVKFFDIPNEGEDVRATFEYTIVGVVPTMNYMGLFNSLKPTMFYSDPLNHNYISILVRGGEIPATIDRIEGVWEKIVPDYPIQRQFLSEMFEGIFEVFEAMNAALAGFAIVALILGLIGLFGLAAFMAAQRTKEVGIRKVLGAEVTQIVRLLVWQFSKPVIGAMALALPLSYFTSGLYLDFFADRISTPILIVFGAGILAMLFSWGTVAMHAARVARKNPIIALRYE